MNTPTKEQMEAEANEFAMELLMPTDLVVNEYRKAPFDLADFKALKRLADKFRVEPQIMGLRLGQLMERQTK